jgi:hypothetical protein
MKEYCFDTSGLSTPWLELPETIHQSLWAKVMERIEDGKVAVTKEVYDEMCHCAGKLGTCIKECKELLILEVGEEDWDWESYTRHATRMQEAHKNLFRNTTA